MSEQSTEDIAKYFYRASAADFMKIPGSPVAYWLSSEHLVAFDIGTPLCKFAKPVVGLQTGDNEKYIRFWFEVDYRKIGFNFKNRQDAKLSNYKWFPYTKGGDFRKWYGNNFWVVDWQNDGERILSQEGAYPRNKDKYFSAGLAYTNISSGSFASRFTEEGSIFDQKGSMFFNETPDGIKVAATLLHSVCGTSLLKAMCPTLDFNPGTLANLPVQLEEKKELESIFDRAVILAKEDWDSAEISWNFTIHQLASNVNAQFSIFKVYKNIRDEWLKKVLEMHQLEEKNNQIQINAYKLQRILDPKVSLSNITLTRNPLHLYDSDKSEDELDKILQCDTVTALVSYAIGCIMGRYSLDKPGLVLASNGETLQDYIKQIPSPSFAPDNDAIIPVTDQEWFTDDATNRFREFVRVVWGDEHLQENLDFVAESLCLHAINPKRGESSLETIRRYLSTQFFKDHLRTYKKRPIYWLFSSGKHKAFECLVYLHRYNESTLSRMRTEYLIPLTAKMSTYAAKLQNDIDASVNTAEKKRLEKELDNLHKQQAELSTFDEKLRHFADQRISLDLDDGVKVNYGKFGDLLAEVKTVTGDKE